MTARTSPARRAAFMTALAATGNQTLAAERAKVSRAWVSLHRASDPAFRRAMAEAIAAARASFDKPGTAGGGMKPPRGWGGQAGEELLVRSSNGRLAQVARARIRQWTPRVEARFLAALASSCNVKLACAAAGLSVASAYNHRRRWNGFAERWDLALEIGYGQLEAALVASAGAMLGDPDFTPDPALPTMTVDEALQLLRLHGRRVHGVGRAPGRVGHPPDIAAVRAKIVKAIERVERVAARDAARG